MFFTLKGNKNSFSFLIKEAIWGYVSIFSLMGLKTLNNEQAEKNVSQLRMSYLKIMSISHVLRKVAKFIRNGFDNEMADQKQNENVMKEIPYLASNLTVFLPYTMWQKSNFCLCP